MQQTIDIDTLWRNRLPFIQQLVATDARRVITGTPNSLSAFRLERKRVLTCIDGGITEGLHLAGSGVLLPENQLLEVVKRAGIEEITTHAGCGAFVKAFPESHDPDEDVQAWGIRLGRKLGLPVRYIGPDEMSRPVGFHDEVVAYFDFTGFFNRIPGLPPGFVVSAKDFPENAVTDLKLAIEIALGSHGFGERFQPLAPFTVIVIEHPRIPQYREFDDAIRAVTRNFNRRVQTQVFRTALTLRDQN